MNLKNKTQNLNRNSINSLFLLLFLLLGGYTLQAQVSIGTGLPPSKGALLQLKEEEKPDGSANSKKGLGLPRVKLLSLTIASGNDLKTTIDGAIGDVWDPYDHIGLTIYNVYSNGSTICPGVYTWDGKQWGRLSGALVAPMAEITCNLEPSAIVAGDNVTLTTTVTNSTQVGTNLTYQWLKNGVAISGATSQTYNITGLVLGDVYACTVENSCGSTIKGWSPCGVYVASGEWKSFMCHNLGADKNLDPFIPVAGIHGAKYKSGAKNSTLTMADDQNASLNDGIPDWRSRPYDANGWGGNSDPCPAGFRVPSKTEWDGVINPALNSRTPIGSWIASSRNYDSGLFFGNKLFLPAAGFRRDVSGQLFYRGDLGAYWADSPYGWCVYIENGGVDPNINEVQYGFSVRCIAK